MKATLVGISIGNSRTQIGRFRDGTLETVRHVDSDDLPAVVDQVRDLWTPIADVSRAAVLLAAVDEPAAARLAPALEDQLSVDIYRVGEDMPVPVGTQLDPETITGVDRLLNAAAAYHQLEQACVVVDAGTAVTVDFVDGAGTFHGGAIAPGAALQLEALHARTAALPEIEFRPPLPEPFGRSTTEAMLQGVFHGIRGLVARLVERYATAYEAWPMVVATGGDAPTLFEDEPIVDRIVPELTLLGIATAAHHALAVDG
ncbi:MAG: type III pantothenate kinase [Planctomycetota bacterium]|jgi:type III pantothenate kinase